MPGPVRNPCLIALGANLADGTQGNADVVEAALAALRSALGAPASVSRLWRTPAWPPGAGGDFVNACAAWACDLAPEAVLALLHGIEADLGRQRGARWAARVIDLDLLALGDAVRPDRDTLAHWIGLSPEDQRRLAPDRLILPHPRLHERGFVLLPLAEVAPTWRHPLLGRTVTEMAAALDLAAIAGMQPL